jgi:hypothetical protein
LFYKHENEYSGNSFVSVVIVLYLSWPGMFENKYSDQWSSEHSLYYKLMKYLMDK